MIPLFQNLNREEADAYSLVLNSAGIGNRVTPANDGFRIDVPEPFVGAARIAIHCYLIENPMPTGELTATPGGKITTPLSGIVVALLLLAAHVAVMASAAPHDYVQVFGADARRILAGEWYRCATALVLHADATHIAGNMAGIALFGSAVCTITGTGAGWLMILACGMLGNLMNAWAYQSDHLSVGASTAVFGAVGILCAIQAVKAVKTGRGWKRVALVSGAGVALLAFLGTSKHSDIGAHLFGCFAGMLAGGAYGLLMQRPPGKPRQVFCGAIAAAALLLSWIRGAVS